MATTFDDREKAFEAKFAHDAEMQFKAEARRNRLLGLWAAGLLGKSGEEAELYAREVIKADFEEAGEEDVFRKTLQAGTQIFDLAATELKESGRTVVPGERAFALHDTYGFPIEMLEDIAREHGMHVDRMGFEREMEKQRERSRHITDSDTGRGIEAEQIKVFKADGDAGSARDMERAHTTSEFMPGVLRGQELLPTNFKGYKKPKELELSSLLRARRGESIFAFDETPFYAEAGGQVTDTGWIENHSRLGKAEVLKVENERGVYWHQVKILEGFFELGDQCWLKVDAERRQRTMRNHTATHILHASLRRALGYSQGIQAGSLVAPDELRFDFKHLAPLTEAEIAQIEELANRVILEDLPVTVSEEPIETAKARGAMALFTEDYAGKEKVRVVTIAPLPGEEKPFSIELCGGTHVRSTGQIGLFKIISEQGVAAGVRRVHVAVGENLLRYLTERGQLEHRLAQMLKTSDKELTVKIEALLAEHEQLTRERDALKRQLLAIEKDRLLQHRQTVNNASLICARLDLSIEDLKTLSDFIEPEIAPGVTLLGGVSNEKASLVCKVSEALTNQLHAGQIIKALTPLIGGGGGGTPRFAQGGGSIPQGLDEALKLGEQQIRAKL